MKLTLFCVSTNSGLLLDVFQRVSVHPVPIEICYGLLSDAVLLTHFVCAKKKNTTPADVFDFGQRVSFLFTFCPPVYLADLSDAFIVVT